MKRFFYVSLAGLIVLYFGMPLFLFFHELGHVAHPLIEGERVRIYLGSWNGTNVGLGRLEIIIGDIVRAPYFGYAEWESSSIASSAGGPLASLLMLGVLSAFGSAIRRQSVFLRPLQRSAVIALLFQAIFTAVPIKYPDWYGSYSGMESDGLRILKHISATR